MAPGFEYKVDFRVADDPLAIQQATFAGGAFTVNLTSADFTRPRSFLERRFGTRMPDRWWEGLFSPAISGVVWTVEICHNSRSQYDKLSELQ